MIILRHLYQLEAATIKAIKENPELRVIDFGEYEVKGSSGTWYKVTCRMNDAGQRLVFCSCEELHPRRAGTACYHMPVAVGAHILLALARKSVRIEY